MLKHRVTIRRMYMYIALLTLVAFSGGCFPGVPTALPPTASPFVAPLPTVASSATLEPRSAAPSYWPTSGWRSSTPEEQGMDSQLLVQMLGDVKARKLAFHSLLVIRNGYLVSETYYAPYDRDAKHDLYSCTKSFVSTLVGIAIDKGYIAGVKLPVQGLLTGREFKNADPRRQAMTLEHVLTMTSGLEWEETDTGFRQMYTSRDWVQFMLDKPMRAVPGSEFKYCSGCSHILSAIVKAKTGENTLAFADKTLFKPLGISSLSWERDAAGLSIGGWGLQMTPRDLAKLGYLYLHDGVWEGEQIVSAQWVRAATQKHAATDGAFGYGYQWWIYPTLDAYAAVGRSGQTVFVAPSLNLIVVTTAALGDHEVIWELIDKYVVPAVRTS